MWSAPVLIGCPRQLLMGSAMAVSPPAIPVIGALADAAYYDRPGL